MTFGDYMVAIARAVLGDDTEKAIEVMDKVFHEIHEGGRKAGYLAALHEMDATRRINELKTARETP